MRIYPTFPIALNEIRRDLGEMGITIHPKTYQDKDVSKNPDFDAKELQNYIYTITQPKPSDLNPIQPWADAEFDERVSGECMNPGEAWKLRSDVWTEFMEKDGSFAYTYPERLSIYNQLNRVIERIKQDPDSRQLYISVWDPMDIENLGGVSRVPCTLGYQVQIRQGQLNLTYLQRSSDFATHFVNDIYLAHRLQRFLAEKTGYPVGIFTHWIGSLHIFAKDVKDVF